MELTNKEAIANLKSHWTADGFVEDYWAMDMAIDALEIVDRLKQAITDEQTADCIIVDAECVNNKHDKEVWLNGYNQALADIRGEEE